MWNILKRIGIPQDFIDRVTDIYTDSVSIVASENSFTAPIHQKVGVYQGCPLSPYLFITGLIPLMLGLKSLSDKYGIKIASNLKECTSAYADDLKVFSDSAEGISQLHKCVKKFLQWTTMDANPAKCAFLATAKGAPLEPHDTPDLKLNGEAIPKLTKEDGYKYLGIREGFDHVRQRYALSELLSKLRRQVTALVQSQLAPWQIIKAIKVYVYSQLDFPLRHIRPPDTQLRAFDTFLVKSLKHLLRLPISATNDFFYAPPSAGGLGLLPLIDYRAALLMTHALQMLHSPDENIGLLAREQLLQVVQARYIVDFSHPLAVQNDAVFQHFLNSTLASQPYATKKKNTADIGSLWSVFPTLLQQYKLRLETVKGECFQLKVPHHSKMLDYKTYARYIKLHMKIQYQESWANKADQGKTVGLHNNDGSTFLSRGTCLWDNDYRFVLKARLNQIDTRSTLKKKRIRNNDNCRHCGRGTSETLPHILNHCPHNEPKIRARHDESLKMIENAIRKQFPTATIRINSTVPGSGSNLKPDIQITSADGEVGIICDLAVAFEDSTVRDQQHASAFHRSRQHKEDKYKHLVQHLKAKKTYVCALVYGSLGSVDRKNFEIYTETLGLYKNQTRRLEYTLSTNHIKASRRIWAHHTLKGSPTATPPTESRMHKPPNNSDMAIAPAKSTTPSTKGSTKPNQPKRSNRSTTKITSKKSVAKTGESSKATNNSAQSKKASKPVGEQVKRNATMISSTSGEKKKNTTSSQAKRAIRPNAKSSDRQVHSKKQSQAFSTKKKK